MNSVGQITLSLAGLLVVRILPTIQRPKLLIKVPNALQIV
jgi:hypothetical protein